MFKRLLPALLVTILLAGPATAQAAGAFGTSYSPGAVVPKSQFSLGYDHPRFYFGTVVRDTADEQGARPGPWQGPREVPVWAAFSAWNWLSLLIAR